MSENKTNCENGQVCEKRTDVLDGGLNVSRETSKENSAGFKVDDKQKKKLDDVRKKGNITDDDPFDFNNPSLKELYESFRHNGLNRSESGFNALYLWCYDNYYSSGVPVRDKYKNIYAHPSAWFNHTHELWRHNKWSIAVKLLEIVPTVKSGLDALGQKHKRARENAWKSLEYSHMSAKKAVSFFCSVMLIAGIVGVTFMWNNAVKGFSMVPALSLYLDGEYVGDVLSMAEVQKAKDAVESALSMNFGKSYTIDCKETYLATKITKGANISQAKLGRAFGEVAHVGMKTGYGLYDRDTLIAVVENREWLDAALDEHLRQSLSEEQINDETLTVSHRGLAVTDRRDYPDNFFSTYEEIRHMFSLPVEADGDNENAASAQNVLNVNGSSLLSVIGSDAGIVSDVQDSELKDGEGTRQISVEIVIAKTETRNEKVSYNTNIVYDDTVAENVRYVTTPGVYGSKTATYHVEYVDDTEISRRLISEVVVSEPRDEEVVQGTRPLTDEEKRTKSTGTYIYPSSGDLSSGYGWRTWGSYDEFHRGMDFRKSSADAVIIKAADGGRVIQAENRGDGYGLCILIEHDDGTITRYAHCSKLYVASGSLVAQGEHIADMGATGWVTGTHLHFEIIKNGSTVNPKDYLVRG